MKLSLFFLEESLFIVFFNDFAKKNKFTDAENQKARRQYKFRTVVFEVSFVGNPVLYYSKTICVVTKHQKIQVKCRLHIPQFSGSLCSLLKRSGIL